LHIELHQFFLLLAYFNNFKQLKMTIGEIVLIAIVDY